ncbi:MAG: c-type cytochrome [Rhodocyclaceae bacterium]|nr:c-type cytochrome [Rhodocyclaceae bacterium]
MKAVVATLIAGAALVATNAMANEELAKKSGCMACHTADKKVVGPAYKDVAKKYAGQKDAEAKLVEKVTKGGKGAWGEVPMPPNAAVKPDDVKTLVKWVLSMK